MAIYHQYHSIPDNLYESIRSYTNLVLLESALPNLNNCYSYIFIEPIDVLKLFNARDRSQFFSKIDSYLQLGYWIAGYFSYESGKDDSLTSQHPLAWFGIYPHVIRFNHLTGELKDDRAILTKKNRNFSIKYQISNPLFSITQDKYVSTLNQIKHHIKFGDIYQLNFTNKFRFKFQGDAFELYQRN